MPAKKSAKGANSTVPNDKIDQYMAIVNAKQQFFGATINMGWQLAVTVLVPLFIGAQADRMFNSSPSYTLTGFFLAIGGACVIVYKSVKEVNKQQEDNKGKK